MLHYDSPLIKEKKKGYSYYLYYIAGLGLAISKKLCRIMGGNMVS